MYVTVQELRNMHNILLPDPLVYKSLMLAHDGFVRLTANKYTKEIQGDSNKDEYLINLPTNRFLTDQNYDWEIDKSDISVFQYNSGTYEEEDISSQIDEIKVWRRGSTRKLIIKFTGNVPQTGYTHLAMETQLTPIDISENKYRFFMKEYISLLAMKHLLIQSPIDKLQTGIATWNLNGTDATVDSSTVQAVVDDIEKRLANLHNDFMPIVTATFQGDIDNDLRYFSPGGSRRAVYTRSYFTRGY